MFVNNIPILSKAHLASGVEIDSQQKLFYNVMNIEPQKITWRIVSTQLALRRIMSTQLAHDLKFMWNESQNNTSFFTNSAYQNVA